MYGKRSTLAPQIVSSSRLSKAVCLIWLLSTVLVTNVAEAAGEIRADTSQVSSKVQKPAVSGTGTSGNPVATSFTDLDCGGGRKLRLEGNCTVSNTNKAGVCRGFNGEVDFSVTCSTGCSGVNSTGNNSCHDIVVR